MTDAELLARIDHLMRLPRNKRTRTTRIEASRLLREAKARGI